MSNVKFQKVAVEVAQKVLLNPAIAITKQVTKQGCMTVHLFKNKAGEVLVKKIISPQGGIGFHVPV